MHFYEKMSVTVVKVYQISSTYVYFSLLSLDSAQT